MAACAFRVAELLSLKRSMTSNVRHSRRSRALLPLVSWLAACMFTVVTYRYLGAHDFIVNSQVRFSSSLPYGEEHTADVSLRSRAAATTKRKASVRREPQQEFTIFYNIFIPKWQGEEAIQNAINIVREQIQTIANSLPRRHTANTTFVINYNTIGNGHALNDTIMQELCTDRITCNHMNHYDQGNEYLTLQNVTDFCAAVPDESTRVIYMHSKGSFHPNDFNNQWRQYLTMSIASEHCLRPQNPVCNACGLQFYPLWTFFFPGNFWVATCEYINTLLPIKVYQVKLEQTNAKIAQSGRLSRELYPWDDNVIGTDRYAAELWIASSPSIIPCDLSSSPDVLFWDQRGHTFDDFVFSMAPRHPVVSDWFASKWNLLNEVANNPNRSRYEYFLLAGHLIKWKALYGRLPDDHSWLWRYFPESNRWHDEVRDGSFDIFYQSIMNDTLSSLQESLQ